jgi:hypothetical protein
MRHFLLSFFLAVFFAAALSANAQVPRMFTYQGVVVDGSGHLIADGAHNVVINIYDNVSAGAAIYTENFSGASAPIFVKGIFNVMIGSVAPPIPASLGFDKGYFLGVAIDGGAEMSPRTAISPAPYAIMANGLVGGAVNTINGLSGAITLQQGSGTTITTQSTTQGSTLTISSTGTGGTGIQGIQNSDPSITIANATGPTASIAVSAGGITAAKIADATITAAKIDASAITTGFVLTSNGLGSAIWQAPVGGGSLTLPFSGTVANANAAFAATNTGLGAAGIFSIVNPASTITALWGNTNGAIGSTAVYGSNTGLGHAGFFEINNPANASSSLIAKTAGSGIAADVSNTNNGNGSNTLQSVTSGTGRAGFFQINNGANTSAVLEASTNGTGNGIVASSATANGIVGTSATAGGVAGVFGKTTSNNGIGVLGLTADGGSGTNSNAAIDGSTGNGIGVEGSTNSGVGTEGYSATTGVGIHGSVGAGATTAHAAIFDQNGNGVTGDLLLATVIGTGKAGVFKINNGANASTALDVSSNGTGSIVKSTYNGGANNAIALELSNGYIKVSGASKTVYVHTSAAGNVVQNRTILSYPGMAATDIVIATHNFSAVWLKGGYGVWWNGNAWTIYNEDQTLNMPVGENFNVIVIKQ